MCILVVESMIMILASAIGLFFIMISKSNKHVDWDTILDISICICMQLKGVFIYSNDLFANFWADCQKQI